MRHKCKLYGDFLVIIPPTLAELIAEHVRKMVANDDDPLKAA